MGDPVIRSFTSKFFNINSKLVGIRDYPGRYLDHILSHLDYYSSIYKYVIEIATQATKKPVQELSVLDFGAGNGLLGMYAKHYGFKQVWMNDVAGDFLKAAEGLAQTVKINIDGFIQGDEEAVLDYFKSINSCPDIIIATDVIEHIYDLEKFFSALKILNPDLIHVFTTASNPYNFFKVRKLRKLQYQDEFLGYSGNSDDYSFHNTGTALSFLKQREKIIAGSFPQLSHDEIFELTKRTRGKIKRDIIDRVNKYILTQEMPVVYKDPYWICDPETGSWTERVLPVNMYEEIYRKNGFSFRMFNGYYDSYSGNGLRCLAARLVNSVFCSNHHYGKYFSPFIVFAGKKSG